MWVEFDEVEEHALVEIFDTVLQLSALTQQFAPRDPCLLDKVFADGVFPDAWWHLHQPLLSIRHHICIPTGMTSGQRSIPHKAAAMTHAFTMELSAADALDSMLQSFCSFTSDMGTEVAMNDFTALDCNQLLPRYTRAGRIMADSEDAQTINPK